jgi:hypothetical protein
MVGHLACIARCFCLSYLSCRDVSLQLHLSVRLLLDLCMFMYIYMSMPCSVVYSIVWSVSRPDECLKLFFVSFAARSFAMGIPTALAHVHVDTRHPTSDTRPQTPDPSH